jgi:hypothetical protein
VAVLRGQIPQHLLFRLEGSHTTPLLHQPQPPCPATVCRLRLRGATCAGEAAAAAAVVMAGIGEEHLGKAAAPACHPTPHDHSKTGRAASAAAPYKVLTQRGGPQLAADDAAGLTL